jgi:hypothetical protein
MSLISSMLRVALEGEHSDGVARVELEHTLYARITDFSFLDRAKSHEHQEQWEVEIPKTDTNAGSGRTRVRKTIEEGQAPAYVLTTKTKDPRSGGSIEVPLACTDAAFTQYKIMSPKGMLKDRYFFPTEDGSGLVWEVDMFYKPGGQPGSKDYYDWVKIDLEVTDINAPLPPLPEGFTDIISAPYGKRSEEDEARVTSLYHNEFTVKNQYL